MMRLRLVFVALLLFVNLVVIAPRPVDTIWACDCDEAAYWRIADGHSAAAPFAWRVLYPTLVRLIPLERETAFAVAMYASLMGCGVLLYKLLRRYGFTPDWALIGVALASTLPHFAPYLAWNVYLVDGFAMLFVLLAIYAAKTRNGVLFMAALTFGIMAKEAVLFTALLWWTLASAPSRRGFLQTCLLTMPALVVLALLRAVIPATSTYSYPELVPIVLQRRLDVIVPLTEYAPFGVLLPLAVFGRSDTLKRYAPFIALIYLQLLFATDTGRLLVMAFPPLVIAALEGLTRLVKRTMTTFDTIRHTGNYHG